ncbi:hypothetical protein O3P69_020844 [Scylla paramamosain]|uniref:Uncharacterized protein n=1 Tax=Scylla paramamosain TaxID=85552 RepID=A0AAW0TNR9_SCYPA
MPWPRQASIRDSLAFRTPIVLSSTGIIHGRPSLPLSSAGTLAQDDPAGSASPSPARPSPTQTRWQVWQSGGVAVTRARDRSQISHYTAFVLIRYKMYDSLHVPQPRKLKEVLKVMVDESAWFGARCDGGEGERRVTRDRLAAAPSPWLLVARGCFRKLAGGRWKTSPELGVQHHQDVGRRHTGRGEEVGIESSDFITNPDSLNMSLVAETVAKSTTGGGGASPRGDRVGGFRAELRIRERTCYGGRAAGVGGEAGTQASGVAASVGAARDGAVKQDEEEVVKI